MSPEPGSMRIRFTKNVVNVVGFQVATGKVTLQAPCDKVGMGVTNPTAKLQVRSCTASTVVMLADGVAAQTANLQEWRKNGTLVARVAPSGLVSALDVADPTAEIDLVPFLSIIAISQGGDTVLLLADSSRFEVNVSGTRALQFFQNGLTRVELQNDLKLTGGVNIVLGDVGSGSYAQFRELAGDPGGVALNGRVYTKDVAGTSQLFFQRSDGTVQQLT